MQSKPNQNLEPKPLQFKSRSSFQLYLWVVTLIAVGLGVGLLLRGIWWLQQVPIAEDPTVLAILSPAMLCFAIAGWMGQWALYHTTARIVADKEGLTMKSALASDALRWNDVEEIRLQGSSGSEVKFLGKGHRVTAPSGSAAEPIDTKHLEAWIEYRLGEKDLKYDGIHFWAP